MADEVSSSSKRPMVTDDDGNNIQSPSVHQVLFSDDLLIEILHRLPLFSLLFIKSVSKRWLSIITSPVFLNLHVTRFPNIHPPSPSGLFLQQKISTYNYFEHDFVWLDGRIPGGKKKKSSAFTFGCFGTEASNVEVLQSCNGLILCVIRSNPADKIYVYNPSLKMSKLLPQVDGWSSSNLMRLAFDPAKSPHYKVLLIRVMDSQSRGHQLSMEPRIYSSETGCWRKGGYSFPIGWFIGNCDEGVYWNDAIHWLDVTNRVRHFKLDLELPNDATTEIPNTFVDSYTLDSNYTNKLFESRGCLLLACAYPDPLEIYEMRNGCSGWSRKYIVKYRGSSIEAFLKTWKMSSVEFRLDVLFIVVGEREEESFVVMNLNGKVVKYNLLLKTLHMLCDIDTHLIRFGTFPFIASLACV